MPVPETTTVNESSKPVTRAELREFCEMRCLQYNDSFSRLADYMTTMAGFQVTAAEMISTSAKMVLEFSKLEKLIKDHIHRDLFSDSITGL